MPCPYRYEAAYPHDPTTHTRLLPHCCPETQKAVTEDYIFCQNIISPHNLNFNVRYVKQIWFMFIAFIFCSSPIHFHFIINATQVGVGLVTKLAQLCTCTSWSITLLCTIVNANQRTRNGVAGRLCLKFTGSTPNSCIGDLSYFVQPCKTKTSTDQSMLVYMVHTTCHVLGCNWSCGSTVISNFCYGHYTMPLMYAMFL